ncbi:MAG: hypothetical protein H0U55_07270 [Rubrobacteraceae bacterium]|nr:hypothetical protein [Rubrobacteraceae bacterium]
MNVELLSGFARDTETLQKVFVFSSAPSLRFLAPRSCGAFTFIYVPGSLLQPKEAALLARFHDPESYEDLRTKEVAIA